LLHPCVQNFTQHLAPTLAITT